MDRARRAEPYSNATIWTREIARNFAGHLDRLSKVHSCVDSASPKSAAHATHSKSLPLKRPGQVSPLKHDRSASAHRAPSSEEHDERAIYVGEGSAAIEECETARDGSDGAACGTPVRRRRPKALRKIKTVLKRTQLEAEHHQESLGQHHENQRLQDRSTDHHSPTTGHYDEYLEAQPVLTHTKKGPPLDFHKRQEQQRIWHENQALAKRLRNTKPTLSSKDWQKDDKWNQSFLKTQERRRQALQHEMARTLASPHSALIRVKHIAHASGHSSGRPQTDHGLGDEGTMPMTVIEVTTQDAKIAGSERDLRRRRSADEDATKELRQQSTAANHRRIMELRKQREKQQGDGGASRDPSRTNRDSIGPDTTAGAGPEDELVSVRFTFSREGCREFCTPSGITGQFSPAVELEAALEASCHVDSNGVDDDALLLPVPTLEIPLSSRLDVPDEVDVGDAVFCALQACIDMVVSLTEHEATATPKTMDEKPTDLLSTQYNEPELAGKPTDESEGDVVPVQHEASRVEETVDDTGDEAPVIETPDAEPQAQEASERAPPDDAEVSTGKSHEAVADSLESSNEAEVTVVSARQDPPTHEMDASGYGSEFDAEDSVVTARAGSTVALEPTLPPVVAETGVEEDEADEYEDDHADEEANGTDEASPHSNHDAGGDEDDEPQYDDDLEPEAPEQEDDAEHSYGDDGFSDD